MYYLLPRLLVDPAAARLAANTATGELDGPYARQDMPQLAIGVLAGVVVAAAVVVVVVVAAVV